MRAGADGDDGRVSHPLSQPRRVHRAARGRLLGGVCRGIAEHLGWHVDAVRVIFVILTFMGGFGLVLYAAYWAWLPLDPRDADATGRLPARPRPGRRARSRGARLGVVLVLVDPRRRRRRVVDPCRCCSWGSAWACSGGRATTRAVPRCWPTWVRARAPPRRRRCAAPARGSRSASRSWCSACSGRSRRRATSGRRCAAWPRRCSPRVGLGLVLLPFVLGWWRDLAAERRARIRSEERAEIAAHLHDSVLQTLALIQRAADDPDEVLRLAAAPGARAAALALRAGGDRRRRRSWAALEHGGRGRGGGRATPTRSTCVARRRRRRATTGSTPSSPPPARPWSTRPSTPGSTRSRVRRGRATTASRCSSATAAPGSTPTPCPRTGTACRFRARAHGPRRRQRRAAHRRSARAPRSCCASRVPRSQEPPVTEPEDTTGDDRPRRRRRCGSCSSTTTRSSAPACAPSSASGVDVVGEAGDVDEAVAVDPRDASPTSCCSTSTCPTAAARTVLRPARARAPGRGVPRAVGVGRRRRRHRRGPRRAPAATSRRRSRPTSSSTRSHRVADGDAVFSPRLAGFVLDAFSDRRPTSPPTGSTSSARASAR